MVYIIFLISLVAVSKGADWLVDSAAAITKIWGISQILVGATLVSLGTTLPEMVISALAATQGKGDVVTGTALGSIIFNTAVILGCTAIIKPLRLNRETFLKAGTMMGVIILFSLLAADGHISRLDSLLLVLALFVFLGVNIWEGLANSKQDKNKGGHNNNDILMHLARLGLGAALVVGGAHYLLESGVEIAQLFGVPEAFIALTLFAIGSSLPELVTAVTAALKGHTDLVLGNVIGANILNIVFAVGIAGLINPFAVAARAHRVDVPSGLAAMAILFIPGLFNKKIGRLQGMLTTTAYIAYLIFARMLI